MALTHEDGGKFCVHAIRPKLCVELHELGLVRQAVSLSALLGHSVMRAHGRLKACRTS